MKTSPTPTIATFGEVLWDILPKGIFLGGAPFNVVYHLHTQGVRAFPITAVGRDFLGAEVLHRLKAWKIDPRAVAELPRRPTGTVRATLSATGSASYVFAENTAWDHIPVSNSLLKTKLAPTALVYGTLALRSPSNRQSLATLCAAWPQTMRVLDINLRPPFDQLETIKFALQFAHVVKLNDEELGRLTKSSPRTSAELKIAAQKFSAAHAIDRVCVTAGARGAGLWWQGKWHWEPGRKVAVRDTVGAGDAFLGALLVALLRDQSTPAVALKRASRIGEFVATRDGATPPYRVDAHGGPVDK